MKKTAVFTSIAMLLSVVHIGFAAESPERLQELASASSAAAASQSAEQEEREQVARDEYKETLTSGETLFQLEHLIMPGYEDYKKKYLFVDDSGTRNGLRAAGVTGGSVVAVSPPAGLAVLGFAGFAAAGYALVETATTGGSYWRHNGYAQRPSSTPVLSVLTHSTKPSVVKVNEVYDTQKCTYFDMETFEELSNVRGYSQQSYLSEGGFTFENEPSCTVWKPERKVHNKIRVSIKSPDRTPCPEINVWKCHGLCDTREGYDCPPETCATHIQRCESPDGLTLASFALSVCGQRLAFGFTNGAVGILHRNYTQRKGLGEGWKWYGAFEERVGKPISQYIQKHRQILQTGCPLSPKEVADIQRQLAILPPSS